MAKLLQPAIGIAQRGFVVDQTFADQVAQNAARFARFSSTSALYLPGGAPPAVGSTFRNPDLAATYRQLARQGLGTFYTGPLAREIAATADRPPLAPGAQPVPTGVLRPSDITAYRAIPRVPTKVAYRGLDVYGMPPSSSGGTTVGEALEHPRERPARQARPGAGAALLPGGEPARLRGPQPVHRRPRLRRRLGPRSRAAAPHAGLRGRALLHHRPAARLAGARPARLARRPLPPHLLARSRTPRARRAATTRVSRRRTSSPPTRGATSPRTR